MPSRFNMVQKERKKKYSKDWLCKIFQGPVVTSKTHQQAEHKTYTVRVHEDANKISIFRAFEQLFDIKPEKINVLVTKGKQKRRRTKTREIMTKRPDVKKAMIRLSKDTKFDFASAA